MKNFIKQNIDHEIQPLIFIKQGSVYGYEVLSKITNKKCNIFDFILKQEENGQIYEFDTENIKSIIKKIKKIDNFKTKKFFINLSILTIENKNFIPFLKGIYNRLNYNCDCSFLNFEITETQPIKKEKKINIFLELVKSNNGRVSIDDFGSGFTTFNYLTDFDIDIIKIDGEIIKNIQNNNKNQLFVRNVFSKISATDIYFLAEKVETKEQHDWLRSNNFQIGQGYYYGKPFKIEAST